MAATVVSRTVPDAGAVSGNLLDMIHLPSAVLGADGAVISINASLRAYAKLSRSESTLPWARLVWPEDMPAVLLRLATAVVERRSVDIECRLLDGDGVARWFRLSIQRLVDGDAATDGRWLCIAIDIDEMKLKELELRQRASLQSEMLNVSVDCIKLLSLDGNLLHMNRAGCRALGVDEHSSFGMPWLDLLPEDVRTAARNALAVARSGVFTRFLGRSQPPGQPVRYWDNMLTPLMEPAGQPTVLICISREITAERKALETLRISQERLAMAVHVGGLGIWDFDIQSGEFHCDETWHRIMGRDPKSPVRSIAEFRTFIHPDDVEMATEVSQTAADLLASRQDYTITFRILHPKDGVRWIRSVACLLNDAGVPLRAVGFVVDITDSRRAEMALQDANQALKNEHAVLARQSLQDPLTEVANRRHLDSELQRLHSRMAETGESICVGMVDVDHFKAFNDHYGHVEGDAVLRQVAGALRSVLRKGDFIARYGGEEFAFILVDISDPESLLDRLMKAVINLAVPHAASPLGHLSISCGCAVFNAHDKLLPQQLLAKSDRALYEAKTSGRNRYVIHRSPSGAADNRES